MRTYHYSFRQWSVACSALSHNLANDEYLKLSFHCNLWQYKEHKTISEYFGLNTEVVRIKEWLMGITTKYNHKKWIPTESLFEMQIRFDNLISISRIIILDNTSINIPQSQTYWRVRLCLQKFLIWIIEVLDWHQILWGNRLSDINIDLYYPRFRM